MRYLHFYFIKEKYSYPYNRTLDDLHRKLEGARDFTRVISNVATVTLSLSLDTLVKGLRGLTKARVYIHM